MSFSDDQFNMSSDNIYVVVVCLLNKFTIVHVLTVAEDDSKKVNSFEGSTLAISPQNNCKYTQNITTISHQHKKSIRGKLLENEWKMKTFSCDPSKNPQKPYKKRNFVQGSRHGTCDTNPQSG